MRKERFEVERFEIRYHEFNKEVQHLEIEMSEFASPDEVGGGGEKEMRRGITGAMDNSQ